MCGEGNKPHLFVEYDNDWNENKLECELEVSDNEGHVHKLVLH